LGRCLSIATLPCCQEISRPPPVLSILKGEERRRGAYFPRPLGKDFPRPPGKDLFDYLLAIRIPKYFLTNFKTIRHDGRYMGDVSVNASGKGDLYHAMRFYELRVKFIKIAAFD